MNIKLLCLFIFSLPNNIAGFFPLKAGSFEQSGKIGKGCTFGDQHHSVGSSWHPNLGFPFGVMYCIRCDCVKIHTDNRNGKEITKVECHDVRKDCPEVTCKGAKVQRGDCCKTCPEEEQDDQSQAMSQSDRLKSESSFFEKTLNDEETESDESSPTKKYVALLTTNEDQLTGYLARATFSLHRGNLHYSVHHSKYSRPRLVQLINNAGDVLFTHETKINNEFRPIVCGVWRNLPKNILRSLDEGSLSLKLTLKSARISLNNTQSHHRQKTEASIENEYAIGSIQAHRALYSETFSSLLSSEAEGSGGAIVMLTMSRNFKSINYAVLFRNIALDSGRRRKTEQTVHISVELRNQNGDVLRKSEKKVPASQTEYADVWNTNSDMLRLLGKGALYLVIEGQSGRRGTKSRFTGNITTVATCDLIQAVMSGSNCDPPTDTGAVGSAIIHINPDNSVSYDVTLSGISSPVKSLQMTAFYRKRSRVITDLTAQYRDGKAVGLLKEISAKELHLLLNNEARIEVSTEEQTKCELRGNIALLLYSGHLARYQGLPIHLYGSLVVPPVQTGAGGHAWVHLDEECRLHYEIVVSGLNKDIDPSVAAHLHGLAEIAGLEPAHKKLLKGFYGTEARGILKDIPDELYQIMNNGSAFLQVATKRNPSGEIRGRFRIPNKCVGTSVGSTADQELLSGHLKHDTAVHDESIPQRVVSAKERIEADAKSCHFEGRWHRHNSNWSPLYDEKCTTCICEFGNVLCNPVVCPSLSCRRPVIVENECCPVCDDGFSSYMGKPEEDSYTFDSLFRHSNTKFQTEKPRQEKSYVKNIGGCQQDGDPRIHSRGSSWNPFIRPFGHVKCVTCTCSHDDKVTCEKVTCPSTPCANPIRKQSGDCCKVCPGPLKSQRGFPFSRDSGWMQDGTSEGMCSFGRELYSVGSTWRPNVHLVGKISCLTCTCERHPEKGVTRKCVRKCQKTSNDARESFLNLSSFRR
uniref:chordin-like isoform X1 n=1 Tax=Styela clava TaxID=7725 RepID=UPI00193948E5|nr:chordin-like isoform X1 [Styela clava]